MMAMGRLSNLTGIERANGRLAAALAPRHRFHDSCNEGRHAAGFDNFVEILCQIYYARDRGPTMPPGGQAWMLFAIRWDGPDSERVTCWHFGDALPLDGFLLLREGGAVADHPTLSVTRSRLPREVHDQIFDEVLQALTRRHGLAWGERSGVNPSTMDPRAALHKLLRRNRGHSYDRLPHRPAEVCGIETPSREEPFRFDRWRKSKTLSIRDGASPADSALLIAAKKDRSSHLAS